MKHRAIRATFATVVVLGVASACLYEVPDVLPVPVEAGPDRFVPPPDVTVPPPFDAPPPFDSGIDAGCTLRCKTTVVTSVTGARIDAIAFDAPTSTAYLSTTSTGQSTIVSAKLDGTVQAATSLLTAPLPTVITALTVPAAAGKEIYFLSSGTLRALDVATKAAVPFGGGDASVVTATQLAAEVDVTNQSVYVLTASPIKVARVSYVDGTQTPLAALADPTTRPLTQFGGSVYWFEGGGGDPLLQRVAALGGGTTGSSAGFRPIFSTSNDVGFFAQGAQVVQLAPNTATIAAVLATSAQPLRLVAVPTGGTTPLPAWVEGSDPGVVSMMTPAGTKSTTVVPSPDTGVGQLSIAFLVFSGPLLFAAGNTSNGAYVVYLHD